MIEFLKENPLAILPISVVGFGIFVVLGVLFVNVFDKLMESLVILVRGYPPTVTKVSPNECQDSDFQTDDYDDEYDDEDDEDDEGENQDEHTETKPENDVKSEVKLGSIKRSENGSFFFIDEKPIGIPVGPTDSFRISSPSSMKDELLEIVKTLQQKGNISRIDITVTEKQIPSK